MENGDGTESVKDKYHRDVKWLRDHVAPDDIYDFAQQALMASEYLVCKLNELCDVAEECEYDAPLNAWVTNLISIGKMKDNGFDGIINTVWRVE